MQLSDVGAPGAGTLFAYGFEDLIEDDWDSLVSVSRGLSDALTTNAAHKISGCLCSHR